MGRRKTEWNSDLDIDFLGTVFEVLDLRSFSNLWYWLALAVVWSSASHFILGVPFDMLIRARRRGGQAERDFEDMVRINVNRITFIDGVAGMWVMGLLAFLLTMLATLGFYYWIEFAQAVFLIAAPLSIVGAMSVRAAHMISQDPKTGEALRKQLVRHRFWIQVLGMVSIFITSMWGMYQNMVLGGLYG